MNISDNNIYEWAERYLNGELIRSENEQLMRLIKEHPEFQEKWKETIELLQIMHQKAEDSKLRKAIQNAEKFHKQEANKPQLNRPKKLFSAIYWWRTGVAASLIACVAMTAVWWVGSKKENVSQSQYTQLKREIETIKKSQVKLIDSIHKGQVKQEEQQGYSGTGFAISNNGFLATNYHVVRGAKNITVQNGTGQNYAAYIYAFEPTSDIAILRIEDERFSLGNKPLPYALLPNTGLLGQRVFTIGYPQDRIVYNEGYISCESGYMSDTRSYQLEITANPGQSGAPVIDTEGHIIALITGKKTNTTGTTFAIHSQALIELINNLPSSNTIRYPTSSRIRKMSRAEQVNQIRSYIFTIKGTN